MTGTPWHSAPLVALDLEGSGAQDREREAILEIAAVPVIRSRPDLDNAYTTLVNPGRPIAKRPWISPGLTSENLSAAPAIEAVEPDLAERLNGSYIVGHNIGVDWRLLHRRCPTIHPAGLIDTLRLARHLSTNTSNSNTSNGLSHLVAAHDLTSEVNRVATGSQPHRALWDAVAAALLLASLIKQAWQAPPTIDELSAIAGPPHRNPPATTAPDQPPLFGSKPM